MNQGDGSFPVLRPYRCVYDVLKVVVSVLGTANSSYLASFNALSQRITEGSMEANNNLKFLESITTPCQNVRVLETIQSRRLACVVNPSPPSRLSDTSRSAYTFGP